VTVIVPTHAKNSQGILVQYASPFETKISLPLKERDGLQLVKDILAQLEVTTSKKVALGGVAWNYLRYTSTRIDANGESVRDILGAPLSNKRPQTKRLGGILYGTCFTIPQHRLTF
jgi:hypothetical protein